MSTFASALSEHPVAAHATGEVIGQVLEAGGPEPDLAVLVTSPGHAGALEDIVGTVLETLRPGALVGAAAAMVLGGGREVEAEPAVALWTARVGAVTPVRFPPAGVDDDPVRLLEGHETGDGDVLVLLADPFSFPASALVARLQEQRPGLRVVGGLASAARGPGGNRLVLGGAVHVDGAVGVLLRADLVGATVVSQGCRPVGDPMTVTRAERTVIYELAGRPALDRLLETAQAAPTDDRQLLAAGVHLGIVIDEHREHFGRGDFLVRDLLGADRSVGAIAVAEEVPVGSTVQFHVRDASTAEEDLQVLLAAERARGALVFTCTARGTHLFGRPDPDAAIIQEVLDRPASAGMACAGELGPLGGRNHLHGYSASVLTFR
jgi:small ligand-binding sensory domain FIST